MRATIRDARTALAEPRVVAALALIAVVSGLAIYLFGYVAWRRFVIPSETFVIGYVLTKIGGCIRQTAFAKMVTTAAYGMIVFSAALLVGAILDNIFFRDVGYTLSITLWSMLAWVAFQFYRLYQLLRTMPADNREVFTDSSDVAIAIINNQIEQTSKTLEEAAPLLEKYRIAYH